MKYTSRADLLIAAGESIKMQEKAGVNEPVVKYNGEIAACNELNYNNHHHCEYEFPLAVVEGKPVFRGDELWHERIGKVTIRGESGTFLKITIDCEDSKGGAYNPNSFSWNHPKPKTVMVELLREDAEWFVERAVLDYWTEKVSIRTADACRKALEKA